MEREGKQTKNGNGAAAPLIPETAKIMVRSLKEILNCSEEEIYAILKDCDMDPNGAVEKFLDQDSFQEVKSKRRRRKEMKEALDSISRDHTDVLSHEGKTGSECIVVQVGSTRVTNNESGEATDKGEIGLACSSVISSMNCVVEENMNSDSFSTDNARQSKGRGVSISASEVSQGLEPTRHADSNSTSDDMLALLMTPSQLARYSNALSSISNPTMAMPEVMKPSAVALPPRSALPHDLTVQPSRQLEQLAATRSYQNHPYMSIINSNPQFSGSTAHNQSSADMMYSLPQSRNQLLADRLPPASVAFVSGNLGFSSDNRETLMPSPLGDLMPSSDPDEILPYYGGDPDEILPYYTGGRNLSSDQQVMKPSAVALPPRSALPQDLTVQPLRQLEQLAASRSYQNHPYMSIINSHPEFSGSTAYNQSSADMMYSLPQSRNQLLSNRLPPASVAFVSGNLGFSSDNRETFMPSPLGDLMPSSDPDEILPYYSGGHNLRSNQQRGSFSTWDCEAQSRSLSLPQGTHYNLLGEPSWATSQRIPRAYSDLYQSQPGVAPEFQEQDNVQHLSSKQSHRFWWHKK